MTPKLYTSIARKLFPARRLMLFMIAGILIFAVSTRMGGLYLLALGMILWGIAISTFWFHPQVGFAATRSKAARPVTAWAGAVALNIWFALTIYWLFI